MYTGQFVYCGKKATLMVGNVLPLRSIPKELSFATSNTTLVIVGFSLGLLVIMPLLLVTTLITTLSVELFVNGEIVQRALERQMRVEPKPQRAQDRPRYNDWTRYVRRRENMR
ncbi:hypothetical protein E1A91_D03G090400v1 [Gossypium mustelinum]|uniref:Uncharacterized protein n=2 Tax=Gossypium TaxID=3633 RepID=A0A5D2VKV2_GOSMU|nr:hypothetical protein ES332_D03G100300v1 [Gossypium tomentosum]TYI89968.1 hypothetical protein E1A91_D03G090400v1 [Gossypium mustelinum]